MHQRLPSVIPPVLGRLGRIDVMVPVLAAVSFAVYLMHGTNGMLSRDQAVYAYAGQRFAAGVPPYQDILNRSGPLSHALPGVAVWLGRPLGFADLHAMRLFYMACAVVTVCVMYLVGRDLFRSWAAGAVGAVVFLGFQGFIQYAADGPNPKVPMTMFIAFAFWSGLHRRWAWSGACVALATLCLQPSFFSTLATLVAAVLLLRDVPRIRALASIVLGGLATLLLCVGYFLAVGGLRQAYDDFWVINRSYTTPDSPLGNLAGRWSDFHTAYAASTATILLGLAFLFFLGVRALRARRQRTDDESRFVISLALGAVAGLLWICRDYDGWPDFFPMLPLCALGWAGVARDVTERVRRPRAGALATALVVAGIAFALVATLNHRNDLLLQQEQSVRAVFSALPSGATYISEEAPQPLVLTRRVNPALPQLYESGMTQYIDATWPGGIAAYRRWVVAQKPTLIGQGDPLSQVFRDSIAPDYTYIGCAPDLFWYARKDLGAAKLAELRRVATPRFGADVGVTSGQCHNPEG